MTGHLKYSYCKRSYAWCILSTLMKGIFLEGLKPPHTETAVTVSLFSLNFVDFIWPVRMDWKKTSHYNSCISLYEAPTKMIGCRKVLLG